MAPGSYLISSAIIASNYGSLRVKGIDCTSSDNGLNATAGGVIEVTGAIIFGGSAGHMIAQQGGKIIVSTNYTIDGDAVYHIQCRENSFVFAAALTITITGSRAFNYVICFNAAVAQLNANTYVGTSVTGQRYNATLNAVVFVNGASSTYLPGGVAGAVDTGGEYA